MEGKNKAKTKIEKTKRIIRVIAKKILYLKYKLLRKYESK